MVDISESRNKEIRGEQMLTLIPVISIILSISIFFLYTNNWIDELNKLDNLKNRRILSDKISDHILLLENLTTVGTISEANLEVTNRILTEALLTIESIRFNYSAEPEIESLVDNSKISLERLAIILNNNLGHYSPEVLTTIDELLSELRLVIENIPTPTQEEINSAGANYENLNYAERTTQLGASLILINSLLITIIAVAIRYSKKPEEKLKNTKLKNDGDDPEGDAEIIQQAIDTFKTKKLENYES